MLAVFFQGFKTFAASSSNMVSVRPIPTQVTARECCLGFNFYTMVIKLQMHPIDSFAFNIRPKKGNLTVRQYANLSLSLSGVKYLK
jgi:hypothetical protein